jgi:oligoendopeptidase F
MNDKGSLPLREEIAAAYKWRLELMYENDNLWEADFEEVRRLLPRLADLKGTLSSSPDALYQTLNSRDRIRLLTEKLYVYAKMRKDEDNTRDNYQELADRSQALVAEVDAALSFITPEILAIEEEKLSQFLCHEELSVYRHHIDNITRLRKHVLSEKEEEILSQAGEIMQAPQNIITMLSNADLTFPAIKDEKGNEVALTYGRFLQFLQSPVQRIRRDAFTGMFTSFHNLRNTFNASLSAEVKKNIFMSRVRRYPSALEYYLDQDNIPPRVYHNMVETVNRNLAPLHRYLSVKKKALGLEQIHFYDLYVPLVQKGAEKKYTFEEAKGIVLEAFQPMGEEYVAKVGDAFSSGWIDVYENKGKTPGGYSFGTYTTPPYILMNYTGTIDDLFTLAHEMGHSMHSYYSWREQPFVYSHYSLFSAEVASTTSEALLVQHLLKTVPPDKKAYIINQYLEGIRATLYRQTLFAEFELEIHNLVEKGEALTADKLSSLWLELNKRYYGRHFAADPLLGIEWARIPHFYYNFYVYKYVTGLAAGTSLSKAILEAGEKARERYMHFLKKGSSDYSLVILKETGVDLETPAPLEDTIAVFGRLVDELDRYLQL